MDKETLIDKYKSAKFIPADILNNIIKTFNLQLINNSKSETVYRFIYNMAEAPKCEYCNKPKIFRKFKIGYICEDKECKRKAANKKREQTNLSKYGCAFIAQTEKRKLELKNNNPFTKDSVKLKIKNTIKSKYNVEHISKADHIKAKKRNTLLKHYGVDAPLKEKEIKAKVLDHFESKYGIKCPANSVKLINKSLLTKYKNVFKKLLAKAINVIPLFSEDDFKGNRKVYKWKCKECGRIIEKSYLNSRIPICKHCHPLSTPQDELFNYIKSIYTGQIITNTRSIIKPLELDIYIPDLKLAFEFNGVRWHSTQKIDSKDYHLNKTKLCEAKSIHLVHIFEHEWSINKDQIKTIILNIINKNLKEIIGLYGTNLRRDYFNFNIDEIKSLGYNITYKGPKRIIVKKNHLDIFKIIDDNQEIDSKLWHILYDTGDIILKKI